MAITTIAGAAAGLMATQAFAKAPSVSTAAARHHSMWAVNPRAGSYDTTLAGVALDGSSTPVTGQIYRTNPASGSAYLANWALTCCTANTVNGTAILADRLWHNGGFTITSTAAQTVNSAAFPARDANGTANGDGVHLGVEISAATGAGVPTITVSYTNQAGTAGRTATNSFPTAASSVASSFFPIGLQADDTGVRSVQSLTLSATWTSGTMNLVAYRPIACTGAYIGGYPANIDALGAVMPRIFDGSVPFGIIISQSSLNGIPLAFKYAETQG